MNFILIGICLFFFTLNSNKVYAVDEAPTNERNHQSRQNAYSQRSQQNAYSPRNDESFSNSDNLLNRINDRLNALFSLEEQQIRKLDALEHKINRMEFDVRELSHQAKSRPNANCEDLGLNIESLRLNLNEINENVRKGCQPSSASTSKSSSPGAISTDDKLESIAVLLTATSLAVKRIENRFPWLEGNLTSLQLSAHELYQMQRLMPTKQFLNNAVKRNHPVVSVMHQNGHSNLFDVSERSDLPASCSEIDSNKSGVYQVQLSKTSFYAYCDFEPKFRFPNGNKWTVILNRFDGSVNFYRSWAEYQNGFGNVAGEFWIGLDRLHEITKSKLHELFIWMEDFSGLKRWVHYAQFAIGSESDYYALNVLGEYDGQAGDSLSYHAGHKFSTFDVDNDFWVEGNCAKAHTGAWWYNACDKTNLNGNYFQNGIVPEANTFQGIYWGTPNNSLKSVKMMIRPFELDD